MGIEFEITIYARCIKCGFKRDFTTTVPGDGAFRPLDAPERHGWTLQGPSLLMCRRCSKEHMQRLEYQMRAAAALP